MSKNIKILNGEAELDYSENMYEFYNFIKENFCDSPDNKWKIKKYKSFIKLNGLSYNFCHEILSNFHQKYYRFQQCPIMFGNFLKKIAKFNEKKQDFEITINVGNLNKAICDYINFLEKYWKKPKEQILKTTHNHLRTNLTWSTFRTYYYEKRFDCD